MKKKLYYVTDTYCCWCFGFRKTIKAIEDLYANELNFNVLNGVMVPHNVSLEDFFNRFPDPVGLHQYIFETSGQDFGEKYWGIIRSLGETKRSLNSYMPAKAIISFQSLGVRPFLAASTVQDAHYIEGMDLQSIESYENISNTLGVNFNEFKTILHDKVTSDKLSYELELVRKYRVQGYPAILIENKDGKLEALSKGYVSFEQLKDELDKFLKLNIEPKGTQGMVCATDGSGC